MLLIHATLNTLLNVLVNLINVEKSGIEGGIVINIELAAEAALIVKAPVLGGQSSNNYIIFIFN